jgi:hypothetical protein
VEGAPRLRLGDFGKINGRFDNFNAWKTGQPAHKVNPIDFENCGLEPHPQIQHPVVEYSYAQGRNQQPTRPKGVINNHTAELFFIIYGPSVLSPLLRDFPRISVHSFSFVDNRADYDRP